MPTKRKYYAVFGQAPTELAEKKRSPDEPLHIWSWNVDNYDDLKHKEWVKKGGLDTIIGSGADVVLLQNDTYRPSELDPVLIQAGYLYGSNGGGASIESKEDYLSVVHGIGDEEFDETAGYIQAEFETYFLINVYVPNSGAGLVNLSKRKVWDGLIRERMCKLNEKKPVILVGGLNVAHNEIDLRYPETNRNKTAGFTAQEREEFTKLLEAGPFVDVYRRLYPYEKQAYTYYWNECDYLGGGKIGWRLDYFIVSERIFDRVKECRIHKSVNVSDNVPISLRIDVKTAGMVEM